jgi:hypothetical protein
MIKLIKNNKIDFVEEWAYDSFLGQLRKGDWLFYEYKYANDFLTLGRYIDLKTTNYYKTYITRNQPTFYQVKKLCPCFNLKDFAKQVKNIKSVTDSFYGEIDLSQCKKCRRYWIKYFYEQESFTKSGRWYRGLIDSERIHVLDPEAVEAYFENLDWYYYGGSFFGSTGQIGQGTVNFH